MFEHPPDPDTAETDFALKVDSTWGGEFEDNPYVEEDPTDAPFGFVVLTSPEEIQVSLDKRDGSHWEVFDCLDAITEGEHTVRMVCTNEEDDSNCGKIHLGHGAPGTIIQMPQGCGPGKYAVAKDLIPSNNQTLPGHLAERSLTYRDGVYDLKFDYDFRRVPRDMGETQMRIDFSNDANYWNEVVAEAASSSSASQKTRKRSMDEVGGNHRRWMEEEWREDAHFGGLQPEHLHKRWFGTTIVSWLIHMFGTVETTVEVGHHYSEDFVLKLVVERMQCANMDARLDIYAQTHVEATVNFGFTLITTLEWPINLDNSFLYFRSRGKADAKFGVDAAATFFFDTGDVQLFSADKFGAAFAVPGIITIGPNFKIFGQVEGEATLGVKFESSLKLAEWDVYQTYPVANEEWEPKSEEDPEKTAYTSEPSMEWGISANGYVAAHIKPTITFGIDFNQDLIPLTSCAVNLVADGYVRFHAEGQVGSSGASFCYGVDAGGDLYATIDAPGPIKWALPQDPYHIYPVSPVEIYPATGKPACWSPSQSDSLQARSLTLSGAEMTYNHSNSKRPSLEVYYSDDQPHSLGKRAQVWGPLISSIPGMTCPGTDGTEKVPPCPYCSGGSASQGGSIDALVARQSGETCYYEPLGKDPGDICLDDISSSEVERRSVLEKRTEPKKLKWTYNGIEIPLAVVHFPSCGRAKRSSEILKWYGFDPIQQSCGPRISKLATQPRGVGYVTEHVYEAFALQQFFEFVTSTELPAGYTPAGPDWVAEVILNLGGNRAHIMSGETLFDLVKRHIGGTDNKEALVLADGFMNRKKEDFMQGDTPYRGTQADEQSTRIQQRNTVGVFYYMNHRDIWQIFVESSQGIEKDLATFDSSYRWGSHQDELGRPNRSGQTNPPVAGLRDLYCYWIDTILKTAEANADVWHAGSTANFKAKFGQTASGQAWVSELERGLMARRHMRFPQAVQRHSDPNPQQPVVWQNSNYHNLWTGNPAGPF
ncbi:hypothetical protein FE257_001068 [Aspergillus nanangensis]|uniref:Uncharacterized protein n=1 Tax=Aspergillus nanangensis TaxID=2582783 RepID=A0AAD4CTX8_ASPNN|nr:hypothetical protein FE257_001068 [Aspergillus nanangensis]